MSEEERSYTRWQNILMGQAALSLLASSRIAREAAYVWTPRDTSPVLIESKKPPANRVVKSEEVCNKDFSTLLRENVKGLVATGVVFRVKRRIKARWHVADSDVVNDSFKECVVVGVIHPEAGQPEYWASARMADAELPEKTYEDGSPVPDNKRSGLPPIMSDWIQVGAHEVPDNLSDIFPAR